MLVIETPAARRAFAFVAATVAREIRARLSVGVFAVRFCRHVTPLDRLFLPGFVTGTAFAP